MVLNESTLSSSDFTIYSGLGGIGLMFWKAQKVVPGYYHRAGDYIQSAKIAVEQRSQSPDPILDLTFSKGAAGVRAMTAVYEGDAKDVRDLFQAQAQEALKDLLHMSRLLTRPALYAPLGLNNG